MREVERQDERHKDNSTTRAACPHTPRLSRNHDGGIVRMIARRRQGCWWRGWKIRGAARRARQPQRRRPRLGAYATLGRARRDHYTQRGSAGIDQD
jgi:hypothetical protein